MIQQHELIERWQNVDRVLDAMPEHERQKHWDMGVWGEKTDCGTVACAAGQCGLDPWFRERGFKLDFKKSGEPNISNVAEFFGLEGSTRIFLNSFPRPVETVIDEVRRYTSGLQKLTALNARAGVPAIGEYWAGEGGIFAGAMLGQNDSSDYYLIVGPEHDGAATWYAMNDWATELIVDDQRDFRLSLQVELHPLFDRVRSLFQPAFYWAEQHASISGCAWVQDFAGGNQLYWFKDNHDRARAVRSLIIQ